MVTLAQILAELNSDAIQRHVGVTGRIDAAYPYLSPETKAYIQSLNLGGAYSVAKVIDRVRMSPPPPPLPTVSTPWGGDPQYPSGGTSPPTPDPIPPPGPGGSQTPPGAQTMNQLLQRAGFTTSTPVRQALSAFVDNVPEAVAFLQSKGMGGALDDPIGQVWQVFGFSGDQTLDAHMQILNARPTETGGVVPNGPPVQVGDPGAFPQTPPIQLPPGQQITPFQPPAPTAMPPSPAPFQAPPGPTLPTEITMSPELRALQSQLTTMLQGEQTQRESLLSQLQQAMVQQEQQNATNQPMVDLAMQNIQSVLSGQAMSPSLQGLVDSAYRPAEDEGARRLRQAAEEAASLRGMRLTDTPIGQPYLEESRRFMEQMGGQRAQAAIGLREQDAAFSERVRQFQEGLKQQALSNRMDVVKSLGTPEQAAQILGTLGLGANQAAISEFGARGNQAISASDLALRSALGQSSAGLQQYGIQSQNASNAGNLALNNAMSQWQASQGNASLGLASQAQGFQQQLAKQQASIQNQLALMGALGDPNSAYGSMGNLGSNLSQQQLLNQLQLSQSLLGQPINFGTTGMTQNTTGTTPGTGLATSAGLLGNLALALSMWGK